MKKTLILVGIMIVILGSHSSYAQNDSLKYRYKNKIATNVSFTYFWDNDYGYPYYELRVSPNIYYYPWAKTGFGLGMMNVITNDITDKSHFRHFYYSHILVQQKFLRPRLYVETGLGIGNYSIGDSATIKTNLKFAIPLGFGFNFKIINNLYIDLSVMTYYQLHELPSDIYRVGLTYLIDPRKH